MGHLSVVPVGRAPSTPTLPPPGRRVAAVRVQLVIWGEGVPGVTNIVWFSITETCFLVTPHMSLDIRNMQTACFCDAVLEQLTCAGTKQLLYI